MTQLPLVVGVDGSDSSLRAVDWASDEAARRALPLRLVHASRWERYERPRHPWAGNRSVEEALDQYLAAAAEERARLRRPEIKVSSVVLPQEPGIALVHESHEALAVVTGSRGRGGLAGTLLGSVSLAVTSHAVCPAIVVRGAGAGSGDNSRLPVVVGVGDRRGPSAAVDFAFDVAETRGCPLLAVKAWRFPVEEAAERPRAVRNTAVRHQERAARALAEGLRPAVRAHRLVNVQRHVEEGSAHRVLLDVSAGAALLVVGTAGRRGRLGPHLGRTAHGLLLHSDCPVAVVREPT